MENRSIAKPSGISGSMLRVWGMVFVLMGIISRSFLQLRMLGVGMSSTSQLLQVMEQTPNAMMIATVALILQAVESCAVPIFCFLLVEGFGHTSNWKKYALRIAGVALVSELPYNFAVSGKLLDMTGRNPVFGLVLAMVVLYFCRRYGQKGFKNTVLRIFVTVAAILWAWMLRVEHGILTVLVVSVLWALRNLPNMRALGGSVAAMTCMLVSPFYLASAMGFLPIHLYNGEKGETNRWVCYLAYPALLLLAGLLSLLTL